MRRTKKLLILLILSSLALLILSACNGSSDKDKDKTEQSKFIYEEKDGEITILGYSGTEPSITIPDTIDGMKVTAISEFAFKGFKQLERLVISDNIRVITNAFPECKELEYVYVGKSVTEMSGAFTGCSALTTASGYISAEQMDNAFKGCSSLTSAIIPASAKSAVSAFEGCLKLSTAVIQNGITNLDRTFNGCSLLKSANVPTSVESLRSTFEGCVALDKVDGCLGVKIFDKAFKGCIRLSAFTFGNEIKEMSHVFDDCISLNQMLNFPTAVEKYAPSFSGCRSLLEMVIPNITDPDSLAAYNVSEDTSGCIALRTFTSHAEFTAKEEFCKSFQGLSSLESVSIPDSTAKSFLRVDFIYSDSIFTGSIKSVTNAVNKYKKASKVRLTDNYSLINGVNYTHIYGGDVNAVNTDKIISSANVITFEPYQAASYWCGYPTGGNRYNETIAIQRTYDFYLRTTGVNDGTLPEVIAINGRECKVGG